MTKKQQSASVAHSFDCFISKANKLHAACLRMMHHSIITLAGLKNLVFSNVQVHSHGGQLPPSKSHLQVRLILYDDLQKRSIPTATTKNAPGEIVEYGYFQYMEGFSAL